jgi:tol-pal system protein YbgF
MLKRVLPALGILSLATGCADPRLDQVLRAQEELRRELTQLKTAAATATVTAEDIQNKLLLLEDQVESHQVLLSKRNTEAAPLPVVKLRPGRERSDSEAISIEEVSEFQFQDLNETGLVVDMSAVGSGLPPTQVGPTAESMPPAAEKGPGRKPFDSRPIEIYKRAFALLQEKQHESALAEFERFLDQYPNHEYSDNCLYWMGEAYYDLQNYGKAIDCFEKVVTLYPNGNKVPDSLLKSALSYQNAGNRKMAQEVKGMLVSQYPGTRAAQLAQEKL